MRKRDANYKKKTLVGYLTAVIALANMPFLPVSATNTPLLSIKNMTVQAEDILENRNVGIDLVVSNNQKGFRANSFGIHYDENLSYTNAEILTNTGGAFDIVCNPEEHLLWFVGGGSSEAITASTLQDESVITLYFDISEDINSCDLALNFVWTGLDGSDAYWYTDTQSNSIDEVRAGSSNGMISLYNSESEMLNYTELQLNPNAQEQLQIINATDSVFWFSSNPEIATVDENGIVSAIASGECQIQAYSNNRIFSCDVIVSDTLYYDITDTEELILTDVDTPVILEYPDATENVTWISANPTVITVDSDGTLHALKEGTANILATCNGKTYMKAITVNFSTSNKPAELQAGDINGDGVVDIRDVVMLNRAVLGKETLTETQLQACDFNQNGMADPSDSLSLMKIIVGLA